jgi:hypothetical protein
MPLCDTSTSSLFAYAAVPVRWCPSLVVNSAAADAAAGSSLVDVAALLGCLGVTSPPALASLAAFLQQGGEREAAASPPADRVARQLRAFVEAQLTSGGPYLSGKPAKGGAGKGAGLGGAGGRGEREYWQRLANVVGHKNGRAWQALEAAQRQYNKVLTTR